MLKKIIGTASVLGFAFLTGLFMQIGAEAGHDLYNKTKDQEKREEGLFRKNKKAK